MFAALYQRWFASDKWFVLIVVIYGVLVFSGLGNQMLWNDEAITAFLGKNVLEYGYPRAHDANNWTDPRTIEHLHGGAVGYGDMWVAQPWIQYYLTAASVAVFGKNDAACRLPFAVFGFLSIMILYALCRRLFENRCIAHLACVIAATSVPFLLHIRQCRYYALVIFFALALAYSYLLVTDKQKRGAVYFVLSSFLLFYSNHAAFIPLLGALAFFWLLFDRTKIPLRALLGYVLIVILFALPWYAVSTQSDAGLVTVKTLQKNVVFYVRVINKYLMPMLVFGGIALWGVVRKDALALTCAKQDRRGLWFVSLFCLVNIVFFGIAEQRTIRYIIHLVPFLAIIEAWFIAQWFARARVFAVVFLVVLCGTNLLYRPQAPRFYFASYLYEITHDYDGPVEAIVNYLRAHARKGDTVKIIYGDAQVMFYLPDLILENDYFYRTKSFPAFIVDRRYWRGEQEKKLLKQKGNLDEEKAYWAEIEKRYDRVELPAVDLIWENRPDDMEYHKFRTVTAGEKVVVYTRRDVVPITDTMQTQG